MKFPVKYYQVLSFVLSFIVFGALLLLVVTRAYHLSFTHDESLSYTILKGNSGLLSTANHHFLNTWLMAFCMFLFGESEFALRLPNVCAFVIYLWVCFRLLRSTNSAGMLLLGIPLLLLNVYLLDFFSVARGYGLSIAFMMLSVYYFLLPGATHKSWRAESIRLMQVMGFATVGMAANLNLINFYIAVFGLSVANYVYQLVKRKNTATKSHLLFFGLVVLFCVPLAISIVRLLGLHEGGQLYYGAASFDNSLFSLTLSSFDFTHCAGSCPKVFMFLVKFIFPTILIYVVLKDKFNTTLFRMWLLFLLIVLGTFIEHWFFSALYPLNRTSVHLIPLFGLLVYLFLTDVIQEFPVKRLLWLLVIVGVVFTFPFCLHFVYKINLHVVTDWNLDADTKYIPVIMERERAHCKNTADTLNLSAHWFFLPSLNYYLISRHLKIKAIKLEGPPDSRSDYVYDFNENVNGNEWRLLRSFEGTGTGLYCRKGGFIEAAQGSSDHHLSFH